MQNTKCKKTKKIRKKQSTFRLEPEVVEAFKELSNTIGINQTGVVENLLIDWVLSNSDAHESLKDFKRCEKELKSSFKGVKKED